MQANLSPFAANLYGQKKALSNKWTSEVGISDAKRFKVNVREKHGLTCTTDKYIISVTVKERSTNPTNK